ncbi:MAG TPA: hypothetical protein VFA20_16930 [Myxococcaceae bacterium]|nr:hypothetical protein [Myxococcaceae bacterium]
MEQTKDHLNLLGIFHYVFAGLTLLCGGSYGLMMFGMTAVMKSATENVKNGPPPEFAYLFGGMGLVIIASSVATAVVVGLAGWCLRARKAWIFCAVIAGLSLIHVPLGTALGVFSLIVLMRPEAKALFAASAGGATAPYR